MGEPRDVRVALVAPPALADDELERVEFLGIGYLAAVARRAGHPADIVDCRFQELDHRAAVDCIGRLDPRVVAITAPFTLDLLPAGKLATMLRAEGFGGPIVVGGHPSSFGYRAVLSEFPAIDVVVFGEGEQTFLELLRSSDRPGDWGQIPGLAYRRDGEIHVTPSRPLIADLDTLPFPARDNVASGGAPSSVGWFKQQGLIPGTSIASARGCPFKCTYCGVASFYGVSRGAKWRARSAKNVVEEIEQLVERWGVGSLRFVDDNFFGSSKKGRDRAAEIARLLIDRGLDVKLTIECCAQDVEPELFALLRRAGVVKANIGIESGVARSLESFNKQATVEVNERAIAVLRDLGIEIHPNFILIDPDTTMEELRENIAFLKRTRIYREPGAFKILYSNRLALFAGTPMLKEIQEQDRALPWKFPRMSEPDQVVFDRLGAIFDYPQKDPRVLQFLRLHRPVLAELLEREQRVGQWQGALRQRGGAGELLDRLVRYRANVGTLAFQTFVRAVEAICAGAQGEEEIQREREALFGELDRYDRLHFGKGAREAAEEGLRDPVRPEGASTPAPAGGRADSCVTFAASPVVEAVLDAMLRPEDAGGADTLPLWNVLNLIVREGSIQGAVAAVERLRAAPLQEAARLLGSRESELSGDDLHRRAEALARRLSKRWGEESEARWKAELEPLRAKEVERTRAAMDRYWREGGLVLQDLEEWTGHRFARKYEARVILARPGVSRAFGFDSQSLQPLVSDLIVLCPPADDSPNYAHNVALAVYHESLHPLAREAVREAHVAPLLDRLSKDPSYLSSWKADGAAYEWEPWFEEIVVETFLCYLLVARKVVAEDVLRRQLMNSSRASNRFMVELYESLLRDYRPGSRSLGEFLARRSRAAA